MSAKFALYYWPIPFRGNFVKVLFAYKQEPLELAAVPELVKLKNLPVAEQPCPFMAPPYLHDKGWDDGHGFDVGINLEFAGIHIFFHAMWYDTSDRSTRVLPRAKIGGA